MTMALHWRHNGHDGVSNHQPHDCLLNRLFRRKSKKTSKLRVTGLCEENSPGTGEFPAQRASNGENVSIWWRHHGTVTWYYTETHRPAGFVEELRPCHEMWFSPGSPAVGEYRVSVLPSYDRLLLRPSDFYQLRTKVTGKYPQITKMWSVIYDLVRSSCDVLSLFTLNRFEGIYIKSYFVSFCDIDMEKVVQIHHTPIETRM